MIIKNFEDLKRSDTDTLVKPPRYEWGHNVLVRSSKQDKESSLKEWHHQESIKKTDGLENEIDLNEIKAALKGTNNSWSNAVKKNKNVFLMLLMKDKKYDWELFKQLKEESKK